MSSLKTAHPASRRDFVLGCALAGVASALSLAPGQAQAQTANWPTQTVKLVVPAPAGSTTDALARMLAEQLAKK